MPHVLKSKDLEIHLDLPNEGYQGTRFDRSGKITEVKFKGIPLTTFEKQDPRKAIAFGKACYNEFGIDTPLGFQEAEIGGWFHKIGVGLLRKEKSTYFFADAYEMRPCGFKVQKKNDGILIHCSAPINNGYAYELIKEIQVCTNGFEIRYHLHNTGAKTIQTDEYCHNFLAVAHEPLDKNYILQLPSILEPKNFDEQVNPNKTVVFNGKELRLKTTPSSELFFSNVTQGKSVNAQWRMHHDAYRVGLQETGSFQTHKINIWGCGHVISPELFYTFNVNPGEKEQWTRRYTCFRL